MEGSLTCLVSLRSSIWLDQENVASEQVKRSDRREVDAAALFSSG